MKKILCLLIFVFVFSVALTAVADEVVNYDFENDTLLTVSNTLASGNGAMFQESEYGKALLLDGTYGVKLGNVGNTFSVMAMVNISSNGGTDTIFFKDMDGRGNVWTGVLSKAKKPAVWTHGDGYSWSTNILGEDSFSGWNHVAYVETEGAGKLYVNGTLVGEGSVVNKSGTLYLGATYWSADAIKGLVDNVKLYNVAVTKEDIIAEYSKYIDYKSVLNIPRETITDLTLVDEILERDILWQSDNAAVNAENGTVTRGDNDVEVKLTASIGDEVIAEFEVTVLKKPQEVNNKTILSYDFSEKDFEIAHDLSGNANHGVLFGNMTVGAEGAVFDGNDDYIAMPEGVLYGHDNVTIIMTLTPQAAKQHVFAYCFGNTSSTGYMFLNPSRPTSNFLRFAATRTGAGSEQELASLPGVKINEKSTVVVTIEGEYARMYLDGRLVMDSDLGMSVSDLGKTVNNFIGKSLYEADPYFKGIVEEFTVCNYCLTDEEIYEAYKKPIAYALEKTEEEYIKAVDFSDGITIEGDDFNRDDVYVAAVAFDEECEITDFSVVKFGEEIEIKEYETVLVFAFNEEERKLGEFFVYGEKEKFTFEYFQNSITIVPKITHSDVNMIVAGYDLNGIMTVAACKKEDVVANEKIDIVCDFKDAVDFKVFYWDSLLQMKPIE